MTDQITNYTNNTNYKLELFTILIFINIFYDLCSSKTNACIEKKNEMLLVIIAHHIFCVFLYFGWIFDNQTVLIIYMTTIFIVLMYWITNGFCHVTRYTNEQCGWSEETKFNEILNCVNNNIKDFCKIKIHFFVITLGLVMASWKLSEI